MNRGFASFLETIKVRFDRISLRAKLVATFLILVIITGTTTTVVGVSLIANGVIRQAEDKVRLDLNSAREVYQERIREIDTVLHFTAIRSVMVRKALIERDRATLGTTLEEVRQAGAMDMLTITDDKGRVLYRCRNPELYGDDQSEDEFVKRVLRDHESLTGTTLVPREELMKESPELAERARIKVVPTEKAKPRIETEETTGMMIKAAVPVFDDSRDVVGVLYGGDLLNQDNEIADRVKAIVYRGETYRGKETGATTIFQGDLRISTNVRNDQGDRAIGTRVSAEVNEAVLVQGKAWIGRAFVVNNWYIAAGEPIRDVTDRVIGMLYVGVLEEKFVDLKQRTMWVFVGITMAGAAAALAVSYLLELSLLKPIRELARGAQELAGGNFDYRVAALPKDEMGKLGETFNFMAESIKQRDRELQDRTRMMVESKRLATLGQLAAGVAHEINNPLGGVFVYAHLLLEDTPPDDPRRTNMEKIVKETSRCRDIVKNLLDFSRQTSPKVEEADVNEIVEEAIGLAVQQPQFKRVRVRTSLCENLPHIMVDVSQIEQVFTNILHNAAEAMGGVGTILVNSRLSSDNGMMEVSIKDTGPGIEPEHMDRLFDPFFTTKEVGHGTGLGLAVSYGIIERHEGRIKVESETGEGTTFVVQLPLKREGG
jgi:two-component system NtrC family sensor kinase